MPLAVLKWPFDHPDWIFELKYDGFRAFAYVENGTCRLVSRNGNNFGRFTQLAGAIAAAVPGQAVLDGEIVYLDPDGAPQFYDLMRRRTPQHFCAFDLLWCDGQDLRNDPLLRRKRTLRQLVPGQDAGSQLLYVDHVANAGTGLFRAVCQRDLEGIVAKQATGLYSPEETSWVKIKNPKYSQWTGRRELFDQRRARRATV